MSDHAVSDRIVEREEVAFARAKEADEIMGADMHFGDWLAIGEGLAALRDRAMRQSDSNRPYGRAYTSEYARLKAAHEWAGNYDPPTISHAIWLAENIAAVTAWRDLLTAKQRQEWVHPRTIHGHFNRLTKVPKKDDANKQASPMADLKATVIKLQEENDLLRKKGGGGLLPGATAEQLVEMLFEAHNTRFVVRFANLLSKRLESEARQDRIEGKAQAKRKAKVATA